MCCKWMPPGPFSCGPVDMCLPGVKMCDFMSAMASYRFVSYWVILVDNSGGGRFFLHPRLQRNDHTCDTKTWMVGKMST